MFAHPSMLAWAAAAAVPLVLHLAGRATVRSADFSAMLFLPGGAAASAADRGRTRERALLLVRSLAVALLAVALARPRLPASWAGLPTMGLTGADRAAVAVVVSDSAGTAYAPPGGTPRSDAVTRVALGILAGLGRGDRAVVVPDPPPLGWADGRPSADLAAAAAAVAGLRPTRRPGDLADALARAAVALGDAPGPRQIVVVCDREAAPWRNVTEPFARRFRRGGTRVVVVPVGGAEADNVAVESVRPDDLPMVRDVPGVVHVTVRNFGPAPRADLPVAVWTGPRSLADTTVSLPAHGSATVDVPVRLDAVGPRLISAAVRATGGLSFDDRRDGVAEVVPPPRVLVVAGDVGRAAALRAALAPVAAVTVVAPADWPPGDMAAHADVVVLADVGDVPPERAEEVRRFVDDGGGLLVAPGGRVSAGDCNESLGDDGVGLLPATLADPRDAPPAAVRLPDARHPAVGPGPAAWAGVRVGRAFAVAGRVGGTVAVSAADGRPLLVAADGPDGGRVILSTVPWDDTWGDLPTTAAFAPLAQAAVRWLAAGASSSPAAGEREVPFGRPIVVSVDGPVDAGSATVTPLPGNRREAARVVRRGERTDVRYDRPAAPGTYRLRWRAGGREAGTFVVVGPPVAASDLTPLTPDRWRTLGQRVGFERVEAADAAVAAAVARGRGGPEGWAAGVAAVLVLLLGEGLLGRWWSGGGGRPVPGGSGHAGV